MSYFSLGYCCFVQIFDSMTPPLQEGNPVGRKSAADFIFGKVIGEGSFSSVYLAKCVHTNKEYASKCNNFPLDFPLVE